DPLPQGEPGDVIRAEPSEAYTAPLGIGEFDADVWRVMYLSTNAMGEPMAVTGTVMVPETEWEGEGERPLVSYAIGTHGLGSHCAPSIGLEQGLDYEASMMKNVIDQGHALVVTDYEGLGTPSAHTYMVGHSQGAAVLDGLRAATRMEQLDVSTEAPMGVSGFSQGGGASVWAGQMQPEYAPELTLAGVAAGGVPADLTQVAEQLDGSLYFAFVGFTAYGYAAAYPELSFEEHLTEKGRRLMDASVDGCMVEALPAGMGMTMDETVDVDLINSPEWQARLLENKPGESVPEAPLYLYHSSGDDVIPIEQGEELRDAYCAGGASVEWRRTFSGPHLTSFFLDTERAQDWLSGQLTGEPDSSTC
ncbi:MAG TPA: lipase family protein, partial [Nocardiopsis listeri]|uniref:lipase family protein n=1 Tax=Nocardiopsis listeri TaxID=53440 RepID=UPI001D4CBC0F